MASKPLNVMQIKRAVREACETDDVSLMSQIVSTASEPGLVTTVQEVLDIGLDRSIAENATKILSYVLQEGADVLRRGAHLTLNWGTFHLPTLETIDVLIAHGWDINSHGTHGTYSEPLLWNVLGDPELVERCLSHGARVDLNDPENGGPRPILEVAAVNGSVEIFELLRKRGALLSPRVLPLAVRAANDGVAMDGDCPDVASRRRASYETSLNMVRHLIDVVRLDVNVLSCWAGSTCSTPLCCIACYPKGDATELIWLLLARGGDPHLAGLQLDDFKISSAYEVAVDRQNTSFLRALEIWQERESGRTS